MEHIKKQNKDWKRLLLRSGLPFEYEVKECFIKNGAQVWDEYSYLKTDEHNIVKEFSYDLDVNYITGEYFLDFLVECKYKTEPTKWFFTPNPYDYQYELSNNSFFHALDYFIDNKFIFRNSPYDKLQAPLGPSCLKGIEIFNNDCIETNIKRAITQLSYAFAGKVIDGFSNQLNDTIFKNTIFCNIPIIITNADLYLINDRITTREIESTESIEEISKKHDFLIYYNKIGSHLNNYNLDSLNLFFSDIDSEIFKRPNVFTNDKEHFIQVLAEHYLPQVILIMHHDAEHENYRKLFEYINFLIRPSNLLKNKMTQARKEHEERFKKFKMSFKNKE